MSFSCLGRLLSTSALVCVLWAMPLSPLGAAPGDDDLWEEGQKKTRVPSSPQASGPKLNSTTPSDTSPATPPVIEDDEKESASTALPKKEQESEEAPESLSSLAQTFVSDLGQVFQATQNRVQTVVTAVAQNFWDALQEPAEALSDEESSGPLPLPVLETDASQAQTLSTILEYEDWKTLSPLVEHANARVRDGYLDTDLKALQVFKKNLRATLSDDLLTPVRKRDFLLCYFLHPNLRDNFNDPSLLPILESVLKAFPTIEGGFFIDGLTLLDGDERQVRIHTIFQNVHTQEILDLFGTHEQDSVLYSLLHLPPSHMAPTLEAFPLLFPSRDLPWFQGSIRTLSSMPLNQLTQMTQELAQTSQDFQRRCIAKMTEIFNQHAKMKGLE